MEPVTCELCGQLCQNPEKLKSHLSYVHSGKVRKRAADDRTEWTCPTCNAVVKAYNKMAHLKTHEEPKYTCDICGKKIKLKKNFEHHMNQHLAVYDYKCEPCNKVRSQ